MYKHFKYASIFFVMSMCLLIGTQSKVSAQQSTNNAPFSNIIDVKKKIEIDISESANSALEAGMPSLAKSILEDNFKNDESLKTSKIVNAVYTDTLISLGEYEQAKISVKILTDLSPANTIRRALIQCGLEEKELVKTGLETLSEKSIPKTLVSWYYLVKGYMLFETGDIQKAIDEFNKAKKHSISSLSRANAEIAIYKAKLSSTTTNKNLEELAIELKNKTSTYLGTIEGFQYAKQYASVLFRLGKEKDATDVINQQLEISIAPEIDKEDLNLIYASATQDHAKQLSILKDVLVKTTSTDITELAIELLSANSKISAEEFTQSLKKVLENCPTSIKDRIIIELAKRAIKSKDRQQATFYAEQIERNYPNSKYTTDALRILAWSAWGSYPPQYRKAAEKLAKLAALQSSETDKNKIKYLEAICYFADKNYSEAAKLLEQVSNNIPNKQNEILNKVVEAYLWQNDDVSASKFIDKAYKSKNISEDEIWNAEWKIIFYYTQHNKITEALERINRAINSSKNFTPLLKMRMLWARAKVSEKLRNYELTLEYCNNIIDYTNSFKLKSSIVDEIIAHTMLLKATVLEKLGGEVNLQLSINTYEQLRKNYPNTESAPYSYLYQARICAFQGHYDQASELCMKLYESTDNDELRYASLSDSAEYYKKIATIDSYQTALSRLDKLCIDYPDNPRNFYARLKQADILRLSNSFADAEKLYTDIINKYKDHSEIYLAYLGQGDSIIARQDNPIDAIPIFERLYSLPNIPHSAKAEAAFKWVFALRKLENRDMEADRVAWLTSTALLKNENLNPISMYWIGRNLYNMAESLEEKSLHRDAKAAYELLIKYKLPSYKIAEQKLKKSNKK